MITIPVLYCKNDRHYHALLPNLIIVPHSSFSTFFILHVLHQSILKDGTIDMIVMSSMNSSYLEEVDITKEAFNVDLSCNGKINGTGRDDVNILLTVNPNTKKASLQGIYMPMFLVKMLVVSCLIVVDGEIFNHQ
ncbi:MAG: hypothetical protein U0L85_00760 [Bacilli bacterium]|nr:hypothetical protein [Bacilli bacterium]